MNKSSFLFFSLLKNFFQCSIIIYFLILGSLAYGDNHIIKSHGISTFGELKYNSDFQHLDYVNPNAPKGGEVSIYQKKRLNKKFLKTIYQMVWMFIKIVF